MFPERNEKTYKMSKLIENIAYNQLNRQLKKAIPKGFKIETSKAFDDTISIDKTVFTTLIRKEVRPIQVQKIINEKKKDIIVLADYITPNAQSLLSENEINYADQSGNIWFKHKAIFIYVSVQVDTKKIRNVRTKAFSKTALKALFQLLIDPSIINKNYREIAELSNVSLGTIQNLFKKLETDGYLIAKNDSERIIHNYEELLNKWQTGFTEKLKPSLFMTKFRAKDQNFINQWKKLNLNENTVWGAETGADLLTSYLKPQDFTLYTNQNKGELMKQYHWIPDEQGDIYVYEKFWRSDDTNTAPPILIYSELLESKDQRLLETAELIYEQYIKRD